MENWILIPLLNSKYEASDHGNIRRVKGFVINSPNGGLRKVGGKNLSQKTKSNGYKEVNIYNESNSSTMAYVHRLVAMAFIGEISEGYEVNHKDGNKANNALANLEIVTASGNRLHAYHILKSGIAVYKGSGHGMAKLNDEQVIRMRELYKGGKTPMDISIEYKTPHSTVCKILYRKTWKHI
jgi:hypothetical protein